MEQVKAFLVGDMGSEISLELLRSTDVGPSKVFCVKLRRTSLEKEETEDDVLAEGRRLLGQLAPVQAMSILMDIRVSQNPVSISIRRKLGRSNQHRFPPLLLRSSNRWSLNMPLHLPQPGAGC